MEGATKEQTHRRIPIATTIRQAAAYGRDSTVENGIDQNSGGTGGQNGGGRGGDGDGDDPGGPPGSGRGGVAEVINHPVLFSASPEILDAILSQI